MKSIQAKTKPYTLLVHGRKVKVADMVEASRSLEAIRDRVGTVAGWPACGSAQFGCMFDVVDSRGAVVATVSYNGRVWRPDGSCAYTPGME